MRKWITLLMTLLVGASVSYANANVGQVNFEAGYRRDNINWKHRFPSSDPSVSSSTRFKDLDIFQIGLNGRTTLGCNLYLRANAYWGWILDGEFERHVSTYFVPYDDYSTGFGNFGNSDRNRSTVDDKYVYGVGAAIGYPFYFCDCSIVLAPVVGYAVDDQSIEVDNEGFNFGGEYGVLFPTSGQGNHCCEQTFHNRWYGPFVGVDLNYRPWDSCFNLFAEFEYHFGCFRGRRSHGDGFDFFDHGSRHSHDANGFVFAGGVEYDINHCWTVGVSVKFQDWSASRHRRESGDYSGEDYVFGSGNERSRSNNKWHSYAINLTLGRDF